MKRILVATLGALLCAGAAQAQTCYGTADTPLQVGADGAFSSDTRNVTAGVAKDMDKFFVRGAGVISSVSGIGSAEGVLGLAGVELKVGASKKFSVCPTVSVIKLWGLDPGDGSNVSPLVLTFGATVGFDATKINTTRVVPTFGFSIDHLTTHFGGGQGFFGGTTAVGSEGESFGQLQLGVGFIFNEKTSLVPSLFIPLGLDEGEAIFSVLFSVKVH